jgi:hypothetical protein
MGNSHGHSGNAEGSSGEIDHEMAKALLNGELYFLFNEHKDTRKQWGDHLNNMIELLSRKIHFMQTHSNSLIDIRALCENVNYMEEVMSSFFRKKEHLFCGEGISNDGVIADETKFMKNMTQFRTMLAHFEQNYVSPDDASAELLTYRGYIDSLDRSEYMLDIATQQEQAEFQKRARMIMDHGIYTLMKESQRHKYRHIFYVIDCYIKNINAIIHNLPVDPVIIENIERIVLEPGCEIFHIIRGEMTPIEALTQLKMKAERLLRTETMAVEWGKHRQEKKIWMDASRHLYPTKENLTEVKAIAKAKALLSTSDPSITSKDRTEMLASGGIMKSLVDALVQPPQSHIQDNEIYKLKRMISKRRSGGNRKTKRRRHKSKSKEGRL